ncbi:hypothetical protein ACVWZZ_002205 [Bradyrhizobium sp. LM6.10]
MRCVCSLQKSSSIAPLTPNTQFRGFSSPASQPTASVCIGSTAKLTTSVRSQVEHSKVRSSNPRGRERCAPTPSGACTQGTSDARWSRQPSLKSPRPMIRRPQPESSIFAHEKPFEERQRERARARSTQVEGRAHGITSATGNGRPSLGSLKAFGKVEAERLCRAASSSESRRSMNWRSRGKSLTQEPAVAADVVMMGTKACQVFVHRHQGLQNYAAAAARSVERRR